MEEKIDEKLEAKKKVAALIKKLIGERSIRQTAAETGVTAPYITSLLKEKYLPSANILRKLSAPEAKPRNGVTLEDLMFAAGYQEYSYQKIYNDAMDLSSIRNNTLSDQAVAMEGIDFKQRMKLRAQYESMVSGAIFRALMEKGIAVSGGKDTPSDASFHDLTVVISEKNITRWNFEFRYYEDHMFRDEVVFVPRHEREILRELIFIEPQEDTKLSLVLNNKAYFKRILTYKDKLSFRGELSVLLFDKDSSSIVKEEYLSHYHLGDTSREFYLA